MLSLSTFSSSVRDLCMWVDPIGRDQYRKKCMHNPNP